MTTDARAPMLALKGVTKRFGPRVVLDRLSLEVRRGEALVIMGPSGSGKTVLLKHLIGLAKPDEGTLEVDGVDFWAAPEHERVRLRKRYGVAFQEGALFDSLNVFENVAFPLVRARRWTAVQIRDRVRECLRLVRLSGVEARRPAELSSGMRRRVGFARAIALEPEILLFDEPTAGLDPVTVAIIQQVMRELSARLHSTTVVVTHDLRTAEAIGDRIALLFRGKLVASAPSKEFPLLATPEVRQFVEGRAEGPLLADEQRAGGAA